MHVYPCNQPLTCAEKSFLISNSLEVNLQDKKWWYEQVWSRKTRAADFARACAVEMHVDMSQEPFMREFAGKMLQTKTATTVLCEPAQSKCTWTCRKSHFMRECRKPHGAPWSSTSLNSYLYPKNPSVWTHTHSLAKRHGISSHIMSRHRNAGASKDTDNSPPAARKLPEESLRPSFHWACRDRTRSIFLVIACYCLVWKPLAPAHKLDRYWTLETSLENIAFDRIWLVLFLLIDAFSRLCSTYIVQSNWSFWICWCFLLLFDVFCSFSHPFSLWSHAYSDVFRVPARSSPSSWPKSSSETSVAIPAIIPIAAAASVAVTRPARETSWNKSCTHVSYVSQSCSQWTDTRIILKVSSLRNSGGQTWTCLLGQGKTTDCCYIFSVGKIGQAFRGPGRSLATSRPSQIRKAYEYWVHRSNHVALCYNILYNML